MLYYIIYKNTVENTTVEMRKYSSQKGIMDQNFLKEFSIKKTEEIQKPKEIYLQVKLTDRETMLSMCGLIVASIPTFMVHG